MKSNLRMLGAMFLISFSSLGSANKMPQMGLAGELIYNKSYAENKMSLLLNDTLFVKNHKTMVDSLIIKYQRLQFATDQVVMALVSSLKSYAKPKAYKKIDKALFRNTPADLNDNNRVVMGIENGLKETSRLFNDLSNYIQTVSSQTIRSSPDAIGLLGIADLDLGPIFQGFLDLYKDSRERATGKANALSDLVQTFRLNPINDLLKKAEPKEEEKDTAQVSPKMQ